MRRIPQQLRGERRVARILDAAAQVFAEIGYDAATTNTIAARANTSIGSVYQFFPNKESILMALARKYHATLEATLVQATLPLGDAVSLPDACATLIDTIGEFYLHNRGFQSLYHAQPPRALLEASAQLEQTVSKHVETLLKQYSDRLTEAQCALCTLVITTLIGAFIPLTVLLTPEQQALALPELKRLVQLYITDILNQ